MLGRYVLLSILFLLMVNTITPIPTGIRGGIGRSGFWAKGNEGSIPQGVEAPYNFTYRFGGEIQAKFIKVVATEDFSNVFGVFSDRVMSYTYGWTYIVTYPDGSHEDIEDVDVEDIDGDGVPDVAILTGDRNIHVVDGETGGVIWRVYPSFIEPYSRIRIMDVMSSEGKEVVIWTRDSSSVFIWSSIGYPLGELVVSGAELILNIRSGDIDPYTEGNEIAILYYSDSEQRYRLECRNIWVGDKEIFDIGVLQNYTGNSYTCTDMVVDDLDGVPGAEVVLGIVGNQSIDNIVIEVYNSSGMHPPEWDSTIFLGLSMNLVKLDVLDIDRDGEREIYMVSRHVIGIVNNASAYNTWNASTSVIYDGTFLYDQQENTYLPLVLWQQDMDSRDLYLSTLNISSEEIMVIGEKPIGVACGVASYMNNGSSVISVGWGSLIVLYDGLDKLWEKHTLAGWRTDTYTLGGSILLAVWSRNMVEVYNATMDRIFSIEYESPRTVENVSLGYFTSNNVEVAVIIGSPGGLILVEIYDISGTLVMSYDNTGLIENNLTIAGIGEPVPNYGAIPLILKSTTNNTYYFSLLNISSLQLSISAGFQGMPNIVRVGRKNGEYLWIVSGYWWNRIFVMDVEGEVVGIRELDGLIVDVVVGDIDLDSSDEIFVHMYDAAWNYYSLVVCDEYLVELYRIEDITSRPVIGEIINTTEGLEVAVIHRVGGSNYAEVYSQNGSMVLSGYIGKESYDYMLDLLEGVGGTILIAVSSYGTIGRALLCYITTYDDNITLYTQTLETEDYIFVPSGFVCPDGESIGIVIAEDSYGSLLYLEFLVGFDSAYPEVTISSSDLIYAAVFDRYIVTNYEFMVEINFSDDSIIEGIDVTVECFDRDGENIYSTLGKYSPMEREGTIELNLSIPEDTFNMTVTAIASDPTGRTDRDKIIVFVDKEEPKIQLVTSGRINASGENIPISVYIWDDLWIKNVYIVIGDMVLPMTPEETTTTVGRTIVFVANIPTEALEAGTNTARIYAEDFSGKETYITIEIYVPTTKPQASIQIPSYIWVIMGIPIGIAIAYLAPKIYAYIRRKRMGIEEREQPG